MYRLIKNKSENAFTLVEILVTTAIFSVMLLGMLAALGAVTRAVKLSREKIILSSLSSDYLEIVRNMPFSQVGTLTGNPHGTLPDYTNAVSQAISGTVYKIYYEVTYIDDPADGTVLAGTDAYAADYKQVKMNIQNTSTGQTTSFVTNVVPKGLEGTSNQGALKIQVIDSQGNPVPNASLHITYPTTTPTLVLDRQTDSSGLWIEVGLNPAVNNYRIVATKSGYSSDQTYPVSASNHNPYHPDATIVAGTLTSITFSIDLLSTLNIKTLNNTCQPVSGINLNVAGAKLLGTPTSTPTPTSLYKFNNNFTSAGGLISMANLEWDTYTPTLLTGQNKIVYGTSPIQKIDVLPNTTQTYTMILGANSTSQSLLIIVKDSATATALENASVTLRDPGNNTVGTLYTGGSVWLQNDWDGGSGAADYSVSSPNQYFTDNGNVDVSSSGMVKLKKVSGSFVTATGTLESATFDTGTNVTNYTILSWAPSSQSASTTLAFQVAANNDGVTWNYVGPDGTANTYFTTPGQDMGSALDSKEFFRYKVFLSTKDPSKSPVLTSVNANFVTGCFTPGQVIFLGLNSGTYHLDVSLAGYQSQLNIPLNVSGNQSFSVSLSP